MNPPVFSARDLTILGFVGFKPVKVSLIGNVESSKARARGMARLIALARKGD